MGKASHTEEKALLIHRADIRRTNCGKFIHNTVDNSIFRTLSPSFCVEDVENLSTFCVDKSAKAVVSGEVLHRKDILWAKNVEHEKNVSTYGDKLLVVFQTLPHREIAVHFYAIRW